MTKESPLYHPASRYSPKRERGKTKVDLERSAHSLPSMPSVRRFGKGWGTRPKDIHLATLTGGLESEIYETTFALKEAVRL